MGENFVGRAIGADGDGAMDVGAPHPDLLFDQGAQHARVGVAVGVASAEGDDAVAGPHVPHEVGQGVRFCCRDAEPA